MIRIRMEGKGSRVFGARELGGFSFGVGWLVVFMGKSRRVS